MNKKVDPLHLYYTKKFPKQHQEYPGIQADMNPVPDCGETSYKGSNQLTGLKMLVTGGDSGIGRAAAIAFAREGAEITINYLPAEQRDADDVKNLLEKEGCKVHLIAGDLSDEKFTRKLVHEAHKAMGGLDNLTMVAGKQVAQPSILDISTEQLHKVFEINVFAMFYMVQEAMSYLKKGSTIITTSSIQAYNPSEDLLDYAATKSSILSFTRSLAKQIAPKGIRVNTVAPGPIWTALQISGGQLQEEIPEFGQKTPLKRAGQPVELANVYVFLASEKSTYVTGESYGITGGMMHL